MGALTALVNITGAGCILVFSLIYRRYLGILGADWRKPAERQDYDRLRASLTGGNFAAQRYSGWLTLFLDWIDRFFGDAGRAERTLFPHAFGLRTPAPLWTAPALDCCLFLALLYPIAAITVIWALSGQVGLAEKAFGLPDLFWWQRLGVAASIALVAYGYWRFAMAVKTWKSLAWMSITLVGSAVLLASGAIILGIYGTALGLCFTYTRQTPGIRKGVLGIIAVFMALAQNGSAGFWFAAVASAISVVLLSTYKRAVKAGLEGIFYLAFFPLTISAFFLAVRLVSPLATWEYSGPALLFLGLLTLIIAPFDWASLGLTRALLRRGLELGGWWPYALAMVDATVAAVIIAGLGLAVLIGVQAFDELALHWGGHKSGLGPLDALLDGMAAHPTSPEYWWIYALLLSTMIPSLANLVIGSTSLVRGIPGMASLLLRFMPQRGGVLKWNRHWIATVLTAQVGFGATLGIAAQLFLVVVIFGYVMRLFGPELLDVAHHLAALNLPAQVGQLFGVSL